MDSPIDTQVDVESDSSEEAVVLTQANSSTQQQQPTAATAGQGTSSNPSDFVVINETANLTRKRALTSNVWIHASRFDDETGYPMARCNYSAEVFKVHSKRNGISSLRSRVMSCAKNPLVIEAKERNAKQTKIMLRNQEGQGMVGTWKLDLEVVRRCVAKMSMIDEHAFRFVDGKAFRELMSLVCPKFTVPYRWTVVRDCYTLYNNDKKELKHQIKAANCRVSLTTDTWTSV
ncbi:hypothetical protein COLO4_38207 [Corchorus olitorius]|uniref:Uncharacterized protein n=1 Tax=Corchorus olitorius TaxID=93759 RepID=A0A1R3FWE7_9ROSI|nr:hypothetical protein COLO4_38207 [Corchorus olitorius]